MTKIADVANVTINIADTKVTRQGFGTILILSTIANTVFSDRVKSYSDIASVLLDFAATTKVYKAAAAIFAQERAPTSIKVGRHETGDASITAALGVIAAFDNDFYCVVTDFKTSANIVEISAWTETQNKIFMAQSSDADVITSVSTDVASLIQASSYNRTSYMWHHQKINDETAAVVVVSSLVATVTKVGHGLRVGDPATFANPVTVAAGFAGNNTVASIVDDDNFTVPTTVADATGTADFFTGYNFPEAAWCGYMLPSDAGSETWKFKTLSGIQVTNTGHLIPSNEALALGKNANLYTLIGGVGHTQEGVMASGRFIDIQRGTDWIEARIEEGIVTLLLNTAKIPYSDAGFSAFYAEIAQVFQQGVTNNVLSELLDDSGDFYRIVIPKAADQSTSDRNARYLPNITAEIQLAGAIHKTVITINASI